MAMSTALAPKPRLDGLRIALVFPHFVSDELASYASPTLAEVDGRGWCFIFARGGLLGFDPAGGVAASTELGVLSLRLVYCCGPIFFFGLAMIFIWSYPLTPKRHARLRLRIEKKTARVAARKLQR